MQLKYDYTRIHVSNYEACKAFYQDILGFSVTFESDKYAELGTGDTKVTLLKREKLADIIGQTGAASYADKDDSIALSFSVPDLETARQELESRGVEFINKPWSFPDWGYKSTFLRDPDGNLLEILQLLS